MNNGTNSKRPAAKCRLVRCQGATLPAALIQKQSLVSFLWSLRHLFVFCDNKAEAVVAALAALAEVAAVAGKAGMAAVASFTRSRERGQSWSQPTAKNNHFPLSKSSLIAMGKFWKIPAWNMEWVAASVKTLITSLWDTFHWMDYSLNVALCMFIDMLQIHPWQFIKFLSHVSTQSWSHFPNLMSHTLNTELDSP